MSNMTRDRGGFCHGDDQDQQQLRIGGSVLPAMSVGLVVLIVGMGDRSLFVQGRDDGPSASPDAVPLTRKLGAAFGSTELASRRGPGEAW
ncbi:MAG: hypothetical protein LC808_43010 [Actinobacteria bacterium]|nr:hypothetical protein [Actinomycetota bacterium]